jgi:hypothetical protein
VCVRCRSYFGCLELQVQIVVLKMSFVMFPWFFVYAPGFDAGGWGEAVLGVMSFSLNFLLVVIHYRKCHFIYKHKVQIPVHSHMKNCRFSSFVVF